MPPSITARNVVIDPPDGGRIETDAAGVTSPGALSLTDHGAVFGPLDLSTPGGTIRLGSLTVTDPDRGLLDRLLDALPFTTAAAGTATATTAAAASDTTLTRRAYLAVAAGGTLALAGAQPAAASAGSVREARFRLEQNPEGVRVRVRDRLPGILPTHTDYVVELDGRTVSEFHAPDDAGYVPPGGTGPVRVATTADDSLLADLRGLAENEVYAFDFTLPAPAADLPAGREITLSTAPMVVEPIHDGGPDATTMTVGETSIRHADEHGNEPAGYWTLRQHDSGDRALVYHVGDDPPHSTAVRVQASVGPAAEAIDDASRRLP